MRIFDNPNHPHYGPVRRMWIVLVQLDLLAAAERWGQGTMPWDRALAGLVEEIGESPAQRWVLRHIMKEAS